MKKTKSKAKKIMGIIFLAFIVLIIIGLIVIKIINSGYEYDPVSADGLIEKGEAATLTIEYNGATGMPESETIECKGYDVIDLPDVTKEGYVFSGWTSRWAFIGSSVTINTAERTVRPQFDKDYSMIGSACALFTDTFAYDEFDAGEYPSISKEIVDMYLDGGYKLIIYSEENYQGDKTTVYYTGCYSGFVGSMKVVPIESDGIAVDTLDNDTRLKLLTTYAPRIWWDKNESYYASTIEYAKENLTKVMSTNGYMYILEALDKPTYMCDYLYGDQDNAKVYAFAIEKEYKYLDLSYFMFTPYNKAKTVLGIQFGNHIGDWEHVTVRLMKYEENSRTYYRPTIIDYSAHSFRNYTSWDEIEIVENTHPVAYTAQGSHGFWKDGGTHVYADAKVLKLTDECSQGLAWDLWQENQMETYTYNALTHTGEGIGNSEWNTAFDLTFCDNSTDAVISWGNRGWNAPIQIYPQLSGGPGGPQQKKSLNDYYTLNDRKNDRY